MKQSRKTIAAPALSGLSRSSYSLSNSWAASSTPARMVAIDTTKQLLDQSEALWPVVVMGSIFATMMLPICLAVIMASSSVCRDLGRAVLKAATRKL